MIHPSVQSSTNNYFEGFIVKLKRIFLSAFSVAIATAALQAQAIGRLADVTVVDRSTGATLPVYPHRGEYWVAGKPGSRYAIAVRNHLGERVLAVMAVDGVNVLSGDTAGYGQSGYVFAPYERDRITGWRKSNSEVAAFEFSASQNSYAARTGRPGDVGVIGVALFKEQRPEPVQIWPDYSQQRADSSRKRSHAGEPSARSETPANPAPTAPDTPAARAAESAGASASASTSANAPGNSAKQSSKEAPAGAQQGQADRMAPPVASVQPAPKLGTAHGRREASYTSTTEFERQQSEPNEVIRIRYDSRENLIANGVIKEPVYPAPAGSPSAFPNSANTSYVPDPPARRY